MQVFKNIRISSDFFIQSFKDSSQIEAQCFDMEISVYGRTLSHKRPNLHLVDDLGSWLSEDLNNFLGLSCRVGGSRSIKYYPTNGSTFIKETDAQYLVLQKQKCHFFIGKAVDLPVNLTIYNS